MPGMLRGLAMRWGLALAAVAIVLSLLASIALADDVRNDVTVGGNDTFVAGGSTTVNYSVVVANPDTQVGCNAADGSPANITINTPAGVTASPAGISISQCSNPGRKPVVFSSSTPGNYPITVTVVDAAGGTYNTTPASFTLKVTALSDTTPPVITVPADITAEATGPAGATVDFVSTATDAVDGPRPVTCTPASGSTFALGETPVTCSASDTAGNSASKSFKVTVVDTTGPVVKVPDDITAEATVSPADAVIQGMEAPIWGLLSRSPEPALKASYAIGLSEWQRSPFRSRADLGGRSPAGLIGPVGFPRFRGHLP